MKIISCEAFKGITKELLMKITLKSLYLQNFATFSNQTIEFGHGLNIIMGETGSGKSLILDALLLILGGKSDKKFIRAQTESATVEAIFNIDSGENLATVKSYFDHIGHPCEDDEVSIKRIIYQTEKAKIFLNGQICNLSVLQNIAKDFVDVVGQFENQKLLNPEYQLQTLDHFLSDKKTLSLYQSLFQEFSHLKQEIAQLEQKQSVKQERESYLRFLVEEYDRVNPSESEEEYFLKLKTERAQWEEKSHFVSSLKELINGDTNSNSPLLDQLRQLTTLLQKGKKFYNEQEIVSLLDQLYQLDNQLETLVSLPHDEIDEELFQHALEKLDQFQKLKKKYGVSMKELADKSQEYRSELDTLNDLEGQIEKLKNSMNQKYKALIDAGKNLSKQRKSIALKLGKELSASVAALNMEGAILRFDFQEKSTPSITGVDEIKLMAKLNKGEGEYELTEIASGGELSRILLALRQITSQNQSVSIFLFDEIDTGIGGKTALLIGKSLKMVAVNSQVLAITHLPQVAGQADHMIKVSKLVKKLTNGERTFSNAILVPTADFKSEILAMAPLQ